MEVKCQIKGQITLGLSRP